LKPRARPLLVGLPLAAVVLGVVLVALGSVTLGLAFAVCGLLVSATNYRRLKVRSKEEADE
jgi:TRAP-type mannitol/chloroaromatic compound transport system permease large subunit